MSSTQHKKTRIEKRLTELAAGGQKGFVAYITAGDPNIARTEENIRLLEDAGVDIIELGIPFSDPVADGRVNQAAAERALRAGTRYSDILRCVERVRKHSEIPILFFSYLNPLLAGGFELRVREAASAGVDGFLILDLPVEEVEPYREILERYGLNQIGLVAPTSPSSRIRKIVKSSSGFIYCISREGVTGKQKRLSPAARTLVERTRRHTHLPVALGFGISGPEQARLAAQVADAVVVGSAIVEALHEAGADRAARSRVQKWVAQMVKAVRRVG